MPIAFTPENQLITLTPTRSIPEKIAFIRSLSDKAHDKINHFDKLRQQLLNYALVIFAALLAFVIKAENPALQYLGCFGIAGLMVIFRFLDQRYHTSTHGYGASIIVFNQVIAYLLENPDQEVSFYQYHQPGEATAQRFGLQTKIYIILASCAAILGILIWASALKSP